MTDFLIPASDGDLLGSPQNARKFATQQERQIYIDECGWLK